MTSRCNDGLEVTGKLLKGQFFLSEQLEETPEGWSIEKLPRWNLYHCVSLPIVQIVDSAGDKIGAVFGYAIDPSGKMLETELRANRARTDPRILDDLGQVAVSLAGRFAAIFSTDVGARIYADPAAQRSIVFNPTERRIASSVCLAARSPEWDLDAISTVQTSNLDGYFPFGTTPERNTRRLLPNHYLDLEGLVARRFWPTCETKFGVTADVAELTKDIASKLAKNVSAIAERYQIQISLTAGRDSRMLLAVSRPHLSDAEFFTTALPDEMAELDCAVASAMARKFGLKYRVLPWVESTERDLEEWRLRVGYAVGGRTWKSARTLMQLNPARVVLQGLCAEVGRANSWEPEDFEQEGISAQELLRRIKAPMYRPFIVHAEQWLRSAGLEYRLDILDLAHMEQRLGCWGGPSHDGHLCINVVPMSDRGILEKMLLLPHKYRFEQRMALDIIRKAWPELLSFPFNRPPGLRSKVRGDISQFFREHPRLAMALRRLLGRG